MNSPLSFEVLITFKKKRFHASSESFPDCIGTGFTKKEALNKLAKKISRSISKVTEHNILTLLDSDDYVEVILDTQKQKEERLIFNLSGANDSSHKKIQIKLKKLDNLSKSMDSHKSSLEDLSTLDQNELLDRNDVEPVNNLGQHDVLTFNFPISLN